MNTLTQPRPPLQIVDRALEYLLSCYEKRGDLLEEKAIAEHTERRFYMGAQLAEADEQTRLLEGILAGASLPADELKAELEAIAQ
jgi:hypothetical protein